jgi:hypothetical protein
MLTMKQLKKFVKMRNESGFQGNLQFYFDAEECGISPTVFEQPKKIANDGGYFWKLDAGTVVERAGRLERFTVYPPGTDINLETGDPR